MSPLGAQAEGLCEAGYAGESTGSHHLTPWTFDTATRFAHATAEDRVAPNDEEVPEDRRGKRLTPEELRAVVELFEIFVRWDDEARSQAGAGVPEDVDSSEPVKLVTPTK